MSYKQLDLFEETNKQDLVDRIYEGFERICEESSHPKERMIITTPNMAERLRELLGRRIYEDIQ
jgi:hypothetical protein